MAKTTKRWARALGDAFSLAATFAAAVGGGWWLGNKLDERFHTAPYLMFLMLMLGLATGLKIMYDQGKKGMMKMSDEEEETRKRYTPSKEAIDAINEAKKMLAGLDVDKNKPEEQE